MIYLPLVWKSIKAIVGNCLLLLRIMPRTIVQLPMRSTDLNASKGEVTNFFKNMFYEVKPSVCGLSASAKVTKFFK